MTANPWSKFFWNDWESDPALKLCSLAAQGLWMRMLCLCAKSEPRGYLVVAGKSLDAADLARLTGAAETEVAALLEELERNRVFSRDRHRRIYNRRMLKDARKSRTAQENGAKGGNPTLCNSNEISASDNPKVKGDDKPHKPKARSQNNKLRMRDEEFEQWWHFYPLKEAKGFAVQAFKRALRKAPASELIEGAKRAQQRYARTEKRYIPSPSKWLDGERWLDAVDGVQAELSADDRWRTRLGELERGTWLEQWGPKPGESGCLVPSGLLLETLKAA